MEPIPPVAAKKLRNMARLVFFMLRNVVSKSRLMPDLHLMIKRGKVAGKALTNLLSHHHSSSSSGSRDVHVSSVPPWEYEFSCSSTPAFHFYNPFHVGKCRSHHPSNHRHAYRPHSHGPPIDIDDVVAALDAFAGHALEEAPPGFGRSPAVRQLRITDSPFPVNNADEDGHVDKAAEEFIQRFYKDLRLQKRLAGSETPYHNHGS